MHLRFTVKANYISSGTIVWICMNEWNRIPIAWLSDASPKARGQELVALTGLVAYAHLLTCGWMNWIANPRWGLLRSPFCFAEMFILNEWWSILIYIPFMHIQSWILWHEVTAEHRAFHEIQSHDRYAYSLAMNYARALLQEGQIMLEGRDKIIIN